MLYGLSAPELMIDMAVLGATALAQAEEANAYDGARFEAPLAALDFTNSPKAAHLFAALGTESDFDRVTATCETRISLPSELPTDYEREHDGHPIVRFFVFVMPYTPETATRALGFLACAECNGPFFRHLTRSEQLALVEAVEDDAANNADIPAAMIVANIDPVDVAEAELWAWRVSHRASEFSDGSIGGAE